MKRSFQKHIIFILIAVLISIFTFRPLLNSGFMMDDHSTVERGVLVEKSNGANLFEWRRIKVMPRPVRYISFCIDNILYGDAPYGFHLTNILLHFSVAVLFYFLLISLNFSFSTASLASLLFLISPVALTSVSVISDRKEILSSLFIIAGLLFFLKQKLSIYSIIAGCFSFLLAVFSKETSCIFPFIYFIIAFGKNFKLNRFLILLAWMIICSVSAYIQINLSMDWFGDPSAIDRPGFLPLNSSFKSACEYSIWVFPQYLYLIVNPFNHCVDPEINFTFKSISISIIGWILYIYLISFGLIKKSALIWKPLLFTFICLAFYICPVFIYNQTVQILNDRYAYMASLGIILLISEVFTHEFKK